MASPSPTLADKAEEIRRILSEPTVDLWRLRELASTEGGLVNDSLRKLAWPKLVGVHNGGDGLDSPRHMIESPRHGDDDTNNNRSAVPHSLDHEQIERDVSRVTWHLLTGNQRSRNFQMKNKHRKRIAQLLKKKQRRLGDYLNLTLVMSYNEQGGSECAEEEGSDDSYVYVGGDVDKNGADEDRLRYYQGFHDVASIVLSALGGASLPTAPLPTVASDVADESDGDNTDLVPIDEVASSMGLTLACQVLQKLARSHLRDAMRANFHQLQTALKLIVMPLVAAFDPQIHSHLADCEMEPYFCLSWVITWFGHDVRDTAVVKRLYDFFLVSHPLMAVYLSVAMMIHPLNRIEILNTDCDFACVHNALADLPKNSSNVGWKYLPGDAAGSSGYVTGEDDEQSYDPSLQDQSVEDDGSLIGGPQVGGGRPRVPFQELIDLSLSLMHKIPPRNLVNLARRYHDEITLQPLMAQSSSIALLQPPPSWGLASQADSDWVLRQRMREESGSTKLNRHQRKLRLKHQSVAGGAASTDPLQPLLEEPPIRAVIASGTGPDGRAEARKLRKKRRMIARGVAVVVLSVVVALARSYLGRRPVAPSPSHQQLAEDSLTKGSVARLLLENDSDIATKSDSTCDDTPAKVKGNNLVQGKTGAVEKKNSAVVKETKREGPNHSKTTTDTLAVATTEPKERRRREVPASPVHREATLQVLARRAKAGWQRVAFALAKALRVGWHQFVTGWSKLVPTVKREVLTELDGESLKLTGDAQKTWKRQQTLLRKLLKSVVRKGGRKLLANET